MEDDQPMNQRSNGTTEVWPDLGTSLSSFQARACARLKFSSFWDVCVFHFLFWVSMCSRYTYILGHIIIVKRFFVTFLVWISGLNQKGHLQNRQKSHIPQKSLKPMENHVSCRVINLDFAIVPLKKSINLT